MNTSLCDNRLDGYSTVSKRSRIRCFQLFLALMGVVSFQLSFGQTHISGVVTDEGGSPIQGVSVAVKGENGGTRTDGDGGFRLTVNTGEGFLLFSSVGFAGKEVPIDGQTFLRVTLSSNVVALEDVVVVGYGVQKKAEVTSSIAQVHGKEIENSPVSNVAMALQGKASGVEMVTNGTPGTTPNIRIRGVGTINNSAPLIVIDGIPVDGAILSQIAPSEIQSIEILKDAASGAIYGTRAANGVVLVTTKSGSFDQPSSVNLTAAAGINSIVKKYEVLSAEELYMLKRERYEMDGLPIPSSVPWNDPYYSVTRTDWQDEFFRNGLFQDYVASITGGGEKSAYSLNINYRDEEGTQLNTYFKRYGASLKGTQQIAKGFTLDESIRIASTQGRFNEAPEGTSSTLFAAYRFVPAIPLRYEDGEWGSGQAHTQLGDMWNPVYKTTDEWRYDNNVDLLMNLRAKYDINSRLSLIGNTAYQLKSNSFSGFQNVTPLQSRTINEPTLTENSRKTSFVLGEFFANYSQQFRGHAIGATAGITAQVFDGSYINATGFGFASVLNSQLVLKNAYRTESTGSDNPTQALASYFARANYNYRDRYFLSGTIRADGSSKFAKGHRWGVFPAISAGWRISGERFMEDLGFVSNFKVNLNWGRLGNQNVAGFQYLNLYVKDQRYLLNDGQITGTRLSRLASPEITWETSEMLNALVEIGLFQGKLNANIAYFDKRTFNMLVPTISMGTVGTVEIPDSNIGEIRNQGMELELSHYNSVGDFSYNVGINTTFMKNILSKLYGTNNFISGGTGIARSYEGEPLGSFYGWKTDGIYQTQGEIDGDSNIANDPRKGNITPGDIRFLDINGDNIVDERDRTNIGNANPKALVGLNLSADYKGFDFAVVFSGALGYKLYDAMMVRGVNPLQSFNMDKVALERWHGPGTSNTIPKMSTINANQNFRTSELGIKSGNYVRLKNLVFGYTVPNALASRIRASKLRVYVTGVNLLTLTKFDGVDPEVGLSAGNLQRGVVYNEYPQSKSFIVGLNLNF